MGFSYCSFNRRFIICTSRHPGDGRNGEKGTLKKFKNHTPSQRFAPFITIYLFSGLLIFGAGLFLGVPKAQAAGISDNLALTRQVVREIAPTIANNDPKNEISPLAHTPDGFLAKPLITQTEVAYVPPVPVTKPTVKKIAAVKTTVMPAKVVIDDAAGSGRSFPYGYCTYYASQRRFVPWGGNAISWLSGAISYGFATGSTPQVGAIMVTSEGGRTGHVAIVDAVNGDQVTVTEMNYRGFGVISSRTISSSYGAILGYIY